MCSAAPGPGPRFNRNRGGSQGAQLVAAAKAAARSDNTYSQLNLFGDVFERIRGSYVEKPDDSKLMEGAINGTHSRYMNEKGWSDMQEIKHGEFGGLGIEVTMEDGLVKVVAPIDDTPAAKAGIMSGDLIPQIDNDALYGLTLDQAVAKMKGAPNSKIRLKIIRKGADAPVDIAILREIIRARPVRYHAEGGDIGYGFACGLLQPLPHVAAGLTKHCTLRPTDVS